MENDPAPVRAQATEHGKHMQGEVNVPDLRVPDPDLKMLLAFGQEQAAILGRILQIPLTRKPQDPPHAPLEVHGANLAGFSGIRGREQDLAVPPGESVDSTSFGQDPGLAALEIQQAEPGASPIR